MSLCALNTTTSTVPGKFYQKPIKTETKRHKPRRQVSRSANWPSNKTNIPKKVTATFTQTVASRYNHFICKQLI